MTDDLERLKARISDAGLDAADAMNEALARIEALRADNAQLREALQFYADASWSSLDDDLGNNGRPGVKARAALNTGKEVMLDGTRKVPNNDIGPGDQDAAAGAAPGPFRVDPEDWTEDYAHENGNYMCSCINCKKQFFGYKRRIVCRVCAKPDPVPLVSADAILHGLGVMLDGKHVPLENFYTKPEPFNPDLMREDRDARSELDREDGHD